MNCSRVQQTIAGAPAGTLPEECRNHVGACAVCRDFVRKDADVRRLLALARYAQPRSGLEDRIAYRVRQDLAAAPAPAGGFGWFTPALLARAAAAVVILFGAVRLYRAAQPGTAAGNLAAAPAPIVRPTLPAAEPLPVVSEPALLAIPAPDTPPERSPFLLPLSPGGIQYGPTHSTPVNFEY